MSGREMKIHPHNFLAPMTVPQPHLIIRRRSCWQDQVWFSRTVLLPIWSRRSYFYPVAYSGDRDELPSFDFCFDGCCKTARRPDRKVFDGTWFLIQSDRLRYCSGSHQ